MQLTSSSSFSVVVTLFIILLISAATTTTFFILAQPNFAEPPGNMGGYDGMANKCTGANEHVCSAEELTAWEQNGGADRFGWYNGGVSRKYDSNTQQNDCSGWTSSSSNYGGNLWNENRINYEECNNDWDVLCCKY